MDNKSIEEILETGAAEETEILDVIENETVDINTDKTVDTESTWVDVDNIGVGFETKAVGINNKGVQDTPNEDKNNKYEYDETIKIAGKYIPE